MTVKSDYCTIDISLAQYIRTFISLVFNNKIYTQFKNFVSTIHLAARVSYIRCKNKS